ncbi:MAG: NAD-dependent epimerase/dehydratase family protein [Rhodospirillaceae bacterium]|jgi:nucleoside-diphosphate-sugar epimerase|nr:NAD-dependent epimerase/dehydratase family protein [Rhodospirillaceae bacterium]MBT3809148.1 NAD-dependent epimerase/dehydratase family protein [Rhodospirillaceae bacterium]MBT3929409.1 NAD-dependent epimerase/dehydratase family protein [Rhodospirillaceae bacterium]MBT4773706.1 NAD-dependent epimerase/dehydratase family protein [Rhodospirillaceae bacterium]MBT5357638.1 NAD-dependent epimerase/dehydratase family protein [Rhodospirillaceae bacterium]
MSEAAPSPLLVIGATGQIGAYILARTIDRPVIAMARAPENLPDLENLQPVTFDADLGFAAGLDVPQQAIATIPIWHLAPLADQLADHGVQRLVCFSTTSVLGKANTSTASERATVDRVYDAEQSLRERSDAGGMALTILRPTLIYGTGRDQTIAAAARFIRRFGFYPVYGNALGARQPVHADDLAAAALATLDVPQTHGRIYALGGAETLSYRDMIALIFAALGRPPRLVNIPGLPQILALAGAVIPGSELSADVARRMNQDLAFDDGSASADFGYAPRAFLAGGRQDLFGSDATA